MSEKHSPKLPVTLLSGFLGSGKTTLLQRLIKLAAESVPPIRLGVVVNDMAEVNVDAELVAGTFNETKTKEQSINNNGSGSVVTGGGESSMSLPNGMVELSDGCICCTLREELLSSLIALAKQRRYDALVIESSGISEPMPVAEAFELADKDTGEKLSDFARLDAAVTVLDAHNWLRDYESASTLKDRGLEAFPSDSRGVVDLLVDQVEFADLIIVNKADLVSEPEIGRIRAILSSLNPDAKILVTERHKSVQVSDIVNAGLFSRERAQRAPGWLKELRGQHVPESLEYGVSSFVFRCGRPLHPQRLFAAISDSGSEGTGALKTVLRSKGYAWIAVDGGMDETCMWSHAGRVWQFTAGRPWWATVDREDWPPGMHSIVKQALAAGQRQRILEGTTTASSSSSSSDGRGGGVGFGASKYGINGDEYGDRCTELVMIGIGMDKAAIEATMKACMVTEEEWRLGSDAWDLYHDPFDFYAYETEAEAAMRGEGDEDEDVGGEEEEEEEEEEEMEVEEEVCNLEHKEGGHGHSHSHGHGHSHGGDGEHVDGEEEEEDRPKVARIIVGRA